MPFGELATPKVKAVATSSDNNMSVLKHGVTTGGAETREYRQWVNMNQRCYQPRSQQFKRYGGRTSPITVCARWRHSFENFLADMGPCPPGLTLERKQNNGNYEPGNCRWDTPKAQANNRRNNRVLIFGGRSQTLTQWCEELGISRHALIHRLERGWKIEKAFTTLVRKHKPYANRSESPVHR